MKSLGVKRFLSIISVALCVVATAVPLYASTTPYDITVPGDTISPRVMKSGGAVYEQKFYVSGHTFSNTGTLICKSHKLNNSNFKSYEASISRKYTSGDARYRAYPAANEYYYMSARASVSNLHVMGNFTP